MDDGRKGRGKRLVEDGHEGPDLGASLELVTPTPFSNIAMHILHNSC